MMNTNVKQLSGHGPQTSHSPNCNMVFGRKDPTCPRCIELINGAPTRRGWGPSRAEKDRRQSAEIRAHNCSRSGCGPVCTFGEW